MRYPVGAPPFQWQGEINYEAQQAEGLLAWWPLRQEANGIAVVNRITGKSDPFPASVRDPSWTANATTGIGLTGAASTSTDANGDQVVVTSVACGTVHTISYWCLYTNYPTLAYGGIVCGGSSTSYVDWINGSARRYAAGGVSIDAASAIVKSQWNHHAWVRNGTSVQAYLNGKADDTAKTLAANNALTISYLMSNSSFFLNGSISDFRIYNRVKAAAEIWQLYDPQTRWELYQPTRPMVWWIPPPATTSIPVFQNSYRQRRA